MWDGFGLPWQVKEMTAAELVAVAERRASDGLGADGRPQWVADHFRSMESVYLVAIGPNPVAMLRCNAIVFLRGETVGRFPIHLTEDEYDELRPLTREESARLLRAALMRFPMTGFDTRQVADWLGFLDAGEMTTAELADRLQAWGVPADVYSVGADRTESYCLVPEQERWHLYYSERGNRVGETVFLSEGEACGGLLDLLKHDGAVHW
ncbi:hypothetical protein ACFVWG_29875 [Kribbella sp. NPDC058245]|uniref:hypothetical protein n=1 Tax=Kribbella sp. NPDC058245 TaxID=3346399 RepID=UPI0036E8EB31